MPRDLPAWLAVTHQPRTAYAKGIAERDAAILRVYPQGVRRELHEIAAGLGASDCSGWTCR